jgi:hypothetical protein
MISEGGNGLPKCVFGFSVGMLSDEYCELGVILLLFSYLVPRFF